MLAKDGAASTEKAHQRARFRRWGLWIGPWETR